MSTRKRPNGTTRPPPWEVLVLVATHLDPKSMAVSSCVSKSWYISMSSDHLWEPILLTHFPSLTSLHRSPPSTPFRRLYALGRASATRRRPRKPPKPTLRLGSLLCSVSVHEGNSHVLTAVKPGSELGSGLNGNPVPNGVFQFNFDVCGRIPVRVEGLRVTWNVVLGDFKGVFTMMDCCRGKGGFVAGVDYGWFTEELPLPPGACCCCSRGGGGGGGKGSGLVADMRLGLRGVEGGKAVVEKVGVGMMNVACWRYLSVDDGLWYLQHFLMPYDM